MSSQLQTTIDTAWDNRAQYSATSAPAEVKEAVEHVIGELNAGRLRVATRQGVGQWTVHQWVKKAVLLSFRLYDNEIMMAGDLGFFDKVKTKFSHLSDDEMKASGVRVVRDSCNGGEHACTYTDISRKLLLQSSIDVGDEISLLSSLPATLTVNVPPKFTAQPADTVVAIGAKATFGATATGQPTPLYQWRFQGAPISGATAATLVVSNVQPASLGGYSVVASNAAGSITVRKTAVISSPCRQLPSPKPYLR